jgi:hypothetical protein
MIASVAKKEAYTNAFSDMALSRECGTPALLVDQRRLGERSEGFGSL